MNDDLAVTLRRLAGGERSKAEAAAMPFRRDLHHARANTMDRAADRIDAIAAEAARLRSDNLALRRLAQEAADDLAGRINTELPPEDCDVEPALRSIREEEYQIVRRIVAEIERQDRAELAGKE